MRLKLALTMMVATVLAAGMTIGSAQAEGRAALKDVNCSNFSTQSAAQAYFLASGGPSWDPNNLDSDGDGIACESLPCPCNYSTTPTTPPPSTPPPPSNPVRSETLLKVKPKHAFNANKPSKFKVTRLYDYGDGHLVPTTGRVALEWKSRGVWKVIQGSRRLALDGHITLRYYITGKIKVRAKSLSPTSYSEAITVRGPR